MKITVTTLNNFDLLAVKGQDAVRFLQGQLTCNVEKVSKEQSIIGAYCNVNGTVISDFRIVIINDCLHLQCARGMGYALKRVFDKYVVFFKASVSLVTDEFERYGISGPDATIAIQSLFNAEATEEKTQLQFSNGVVYKLDGEPDRYEILVSHQDHDTLKSLFELGVTNDMHEWNLADIRQGIFHITPEFQSKYTPQLLNYDLNGIVDFKKGCYPGQEIIARMQYRTIAKKRMYHVRARNISTSVESLILSNGASIGEILRAVAIESGACEFLVILPCELVEQTNSLEVQDLYRTDQDANRVTKLEISIASR